MPSYAKVLTETYLPAQAAKARWESAKTVAGAQFDALAEQRKALDEVRLRRQQYADNIRPRESADAFQMAALQKGLELSGLAGVPGATPVSPEYQAALNTVANIPANATSGNADYVAAVAGLKSAESVEQYDRLRKAILAKVPQANLPGAPASLKTEEQRSAGRRAVAAQRGQQGVSVQEMRELADSLGARAFQGGEEARLFYKGLPAEDQEALNLYQNALLDDGVVSPDELPEGMLERGAQRYKEAAAKGAYRRQDRGAYDEGYLDLLKDMSTKETALKEAEARLQGKTKETFAEELYTGAAERAAIPPLLRSLEPEMKRYLDGYSSAVSSDPKTDPEGYLKSKLTDREAKGFSAASAMAASGMRAQDIMDNLRALSPEERRSVMGALASRDAIVSTQMRVAPGTPLPEIEKIQAEDRRAQEAELARTESRLRRRLRELDESLAAGRESGFGGIVSPDTGARRAPAVSPRREVLMGALSPEEGALSPEEMDRLEQTPEGAEQLDRMLAKRSMRDVELGRQEVERIATERDLARIERDRLMDTGLAGYDPATELQEPVPTRPIPSRRKTGYEDRAERSRQVAETEQERADLALRTYREVQGLDEPVRNAVRGALMQGLTPAPSVGPSRADLRQDYEITGASKTVGPEEESVVTPAPDKIFKRKYNPATGEIELIEVK